MRTILQVQNALLKDNVDLLERNIDANLDYYGEAEFSSSWLTHPKTAALITQYEANGFILVQIDTHTLLLYMP